MIQQEQDSRGYKAKDGPEVRDQIAGKVVGSDHPDTGFLARHHLRWLQMQMVSGLGLFENIPVMLNFGKG